MRSRCAWWLVVLVGCAFVTDCSGDESPGLRTTQSSGGSDNAGGAGGTGGTGGGGTGGSGALGTGGLLDPRSDASTDAGPCYECKNPGGQYCGKIGKGCKDEVLDCGDCENRNFTCGGGGIPGVCGADPDAGCPVTVCDLGIAGKYCGPIGNG